MANAGRTFGLPSTVLMNLARTHHAVRRRFLPLHWQGSWNPQLANDPTAYKIPDRKPGARDTLRHERLSQWAAQDEDVFNPVGEVIKLAEGRNNLSLGRIFRSTYKR